MPGDYLDFVIDALSGWHRVSGRRMFGGCGVYRQGVMFALIVGDMLYFKADDSNRTDYQQAGSGPFVYHARGKPVALSYWLVPIDVLEDRETLGHWAQKAYLAGLKAQAAKPPKQHRRRSGSGVFGPDGG